MRSSRKLFGFFRVNKRFSSDTSHHETHSHPILKHLPLVGVMVGISAFSFQIGVLFPWHEELSTQFTALEVKNFFLCSQYINTFQDVTHKIETYISDLHQNVADVKALVELVKIKERKVLDKEEEVLQKLDHLLAEKKRRGL